jgi:hypothetical protein
MLIFPTLYKKRKQKGKSKYIANSAEIEQAGGRRPKFGSRKIVGIIDRNFLCLLDEIWPKGLDPIFY